MRIKLAILALILPLYAVAQTSTPPMRASITINELDPFIQEAYDTQVAGAAKAIVDKLDPSHNLRNGFCRYSLEGQSVYYEQYTIHSSIQVEKNGQYFKDYHSEGESRKTGESYISRFWIGGTGKYTETIEKVDEGFFYLVSNTLYYAKEVNGKGEQRLGDAGVEIGYSPVQVKFSKLELLSTVYEGCSGEIELLLTDTQNRYVLDGYTIEVSSDNPAVLSVESGKVTTDGEGKARIKVNGIKKGKAKVKVRIDLNEDRTNSHVNAEREIEVEVKDLGTWDYTINVHDAFSEPAHDYVLNGRFTVKASMGADSLMHFSLTDLSNVSKSDGGSFSVKGLFYNELDMNDGFCLAFNPEGVTAIAEEAQASLGERLADVFIDVIKSGITGSHVGETTNSQNPITTVMSLLEEGSWPFKLDMDVLFQISGVNSSAMEGDFEITEDTQQATKSIQVAYLKEHHSLAMPDLTQMLLLQTGNLWKEIDKSGGDLYTGSLTGTITLKKLEE